MPSNNPANAALEQLQKALDSGLTQLGSLRGDLSTSGRQQLRDLEKRIRELRKDLDKNGRKLLKELEDRVAAASGGRVGSTSRSRSTTTRRKPATAAKATARKTTTKAKPKAKAAARKTSTAAKTTARKTSGGARSTARKASTGTRRAASSTSRSRSTRSTKK